MAYEDRKRSDRDTAARCATQGISLMPVVAESFSGFGLTAQKAFNIIARAYARRSALTVGLATTQLYEGLSTRIMRANARSVLARAPVDELNCEAGATERARQAWAATAQD